MAFFKSIMGRQFGLGPAGQLNAQGIDITRPCADASITVGDESANVRAITIQLKDVNGDDIDYIEAVWGILTTTATLAGLAAPAPSTGLAIGTDGASMTVKAHNLYLLTSESDGDIDLTWTETGAVVAYLHLLLPTGRIITSDALTNAA